ncbi:Pr6Pr family membrane protein [Duganella violaceipulchra]|uniref:Pr6Pr family membrane protein n=1 Tax=Duganella violaceipulchra TaxID=2849652 RepID=UPI002FCD63C8
MVWLGSATVAVSARRQVAGRQPGAVLYFGFFTITSNLFVALVLTLPLAVGGTRAGRWFASDSTLSCATTAIVFVCIASHFLLRHVWNPQGG